MQPDPTGDSSQPAQPDNNQIVAFCLLVVCGGVLAKLYLNLHVAGSFASMALVAFAILGRPFFRAREFFLLTLAVTLTLVALWTRADVFPMVARALDRAAFLAAFMILLALLREGAETSPSVLAVGRYLTRQRPGRRYIAIQTGGHLLGVILNFGCLSLLGPLIQRGARASARESDAQDSGPADPAVEEKLAEIREQRQITALSRGFSWIVAWSPTTISQAFVPLVLTGVEPLRMAVLGAIITLFFFLAGWLEDLFRGGRIRARLSALGQLPVASPLPFPKVAFSRFALVCLILALLSAGVVITSGSAIVPALMLTAPFVTVVWIWLQNKDSEEGWQATVTRGKEIVTGSIPRSSPEALTLSVAGYSGIMAAGLTDAEALAALIGLEGIPPLAIYLTVLALVPLASNLAIPSMLTVTFLGSLFSALPELNLDPTLLGFSLVIGWGLNLLASPFGATSLVLSRVTGISGIKLSWRWNGLYGLVSYAISALYLALLTSI